MEILFINIKDIFINNEIWNFYFNLLNKNEQIKINKFIANDDIKRSFASLVLQNYVIKKKFNISFGSIEIKRNIYNKPFVDNFEYNISHDKDFVMIVTNNYPIGIDIMSIHRKIDKSLYPLVLNKDENMQIKEKKDFFIFWCLKESYLKAIGTGLHDTLDNIVFNIKNKYNITLHINGILIKNLYFNYFIFKSEYIVAISYKSNFNIKEKFIYPLEFDINDKDNYVK